MNYTEYEGGQLGTPKLSLAHAGGEVPLVIFCSFPSTLECHHCAVLYSGKTVHCVVCLQFMLQNFPTSTAQSIAEVVLLPQYIRVRAVRVTPVLVPQPPISSARSRCAVQGCAWLYCTVLGCTVRAQRSYSVIYCVLWLLVA